MGKVIFIGAGPGSSELLTLGALRHLRRAEVILYDALVSREVLELAPASAELIYVGKRAFRHHRSQNEINRLLVELAECHKIVVRLKGGDTTVFARLAEEIEYLRNHGLTYEVVAGVTACSAAAAGINIPLTNRDFASEFLMTTVSSYDQPQTCRAIAMLLNQDSGVSVYMPLVGGERIPKKLIQAGAHSYHPLVAVVNATLPDQRVLCTSLKSANFFQIRNTSQGDPIILLMGRPFRELAVDVSQHHHFQVLKQSSTGDFSRNEFLQSTIQGL